MFHNSAASAPAGDVRSRVVIDVAVLQIVLRVLTGWLERREREAIAYLTEENRLLRRQLVGRSTIRRILKAAGLPHLSRRGRRRGTRS